MSGHGVAMVTGAGQGIGRAIAESALACGYTVLAVDKDPSGIESLAAAAQGPGQAHALSCDLTDFERTAEWVDRVVAEFGPPDVLFNNAGSGRFGPLETTALADWQAILDLNLTSVFVLTQAVGRHMIAARRGSIVTTASIAASAFNVGSQAYSPSKAAVEMLTRGFAVEWGCYGIRANSVSPGYTRTPLTEPIFADEETLQRRLAKIPLRRIAGPEEIADVALFLASDAARYVSGQNWVVDGGALTTALSMPGIPLAGAWS
jgi:NAD(P)-dependent dehydrogenase (short-subunit alcohol dehydrogenase family)